MSALPMSSLESTTPSTSAELMALVLRCTCCGEDRVFEPPPCPDGHDDCPDLMCTECGLVVG